MGEVVEFPEKNQFHELADPALLRKGATCATKAATILTSDPSEDDLLEAMALLNDAWGVCAAFLIFTREPM